MALTDKIIIDVDAETARLWREAGDQERLRLMLKLQLELSNKSAGKTSSKQDVIKEIERLHKNTVAKGIDEQAQKELLDDLGKS